MPSRQINDFLPKRKQKKIELVPRPGNSSSGEDSSGGEDSEGANTTLDVGAAKKEESQVKREPEVSAVSTSASKNAEIPIPSLAPGKPQTIATTSTITTTRSEYKLNFFLFAFC